MKKIFLIVAVAAGLVGCQTQPQNSQEVAALRQAYSACINTAEGSNEKLDACKAVLEVLRKEEQHKAFAEQETVRVFDYQRCIEATRTGNGEAVSTDCGKVWQEIRSNNTMGAN